MEIQGSCASEFDQVREEFARNFADRGEVGASVCVTVEGETVVDLWGGVADPGSDMPRASPIDDMVLAVNMPAHDPSPGQAAFSMSSRSSRLMCPAAQAPTASNTSWMLMSLSQ